MLNFLLEFSVRQRALVLLGAFVSPHFHRRYLMIAGAVAHVVALCHVAMLIAGFMQLYGDTSLWLALMMPVGLCPIVLALVALGVALRWAADVLMLVLRAPLQSRKS